MNKSIVIAVALVSAVITLTTFLDMGVFTTTSTTYTPAAWPLAWQPLILANSQSLQDGDDINGTNSGFLDLYYSDAPHATSAYIAFENNTCYFRLQLQGCPGSPGAMSNATWIAQIKNLSTGVVGAVAIDGNKLQLSVVRITLPEAEDIIYTDQGLGSAFRSAVAITPVWTNIVNPLVPNSASNHYLDFQVPIAALNGGNTQLGITASTPIQFFFGSSQASTHTGVINKDWMVGTTVNWAVSDTTTIVDAGSGPLPVELTSFTAHMENGVSRLRWNTATETNNYGFFVLRSTDGDLWQEIGFVPGAGTSAVPLSYTFEDRSTPHSTDQVYYRLRQMDRDGSLEYTSVVMVHNSLVTAVEITDAYPNPFNPTTTVSYTLNIETSVRLSLVDMSGKTVQVISDWKPENAGSHSVMIDAGTLPSGKYLVLLQTPQNQSVRKVVLMK